MDDMIWAAVLGALSTVVIVSWLLSAVALQVLKSGGIDPADWIRAIFHELKPFYLPATFGSYLIESVTAGDGINGWRVFFLCLNVFNWWVCRDIDDDDRWKRRRRELAAKVRSVGHKLVVVSDA